MIRETRPSGNTGWIIFAIPDQQAQRNIAQVSIPCLASAFYGDLSCTTGMPGLDLTPKADQPMMAPVFWGFRVMFYASLLMFGTVFYATILRFRRKLWTSPRFHRFLLWSTPMGIIAVLSGWILAETGRQPWLVYGKLLTADAVSPLNTWQVLTSLALLILVYAMLLGTYIWYVARVVRQGPEDQPVPEPVRAPVAPTPRVLGAGRRT